MENSSLPLKTRLAPTPSGFLHAGNALNFVLTWKWARENKAKLLLRIDDHDITRKRLEYVENVFETLKWLGLDWDEGPTGVDDFEKKYSQDLKRDYYFQELKKLKNLFQCDCSRKDLKEFSSYPGNCRSLQKPYVRESTAIRLIFEAHEHGCTDEFQDMILWRKDGLPSYQLVSVIEDRDQNITHLIRGRDLKESTDFQKALAKMAGWKFPDEVVHHELITNHQGHKLSKSQKASPLFQEFKKPTDFYENVMSSFLGLKEKVSSAEDLLSRN